MNSKSLVSSKEVKVETDQSDHAKVMSSECLISRSHFLAKQQQQQNSHCVSSQYWLVIPPVDQSHCCLQGLSPTSNRDTEKRLSTGSDISGSSLDKILERSDDHKRVASSQGESSEDMKTRRYEAWGLI